MIPRYEWRRRRGPTRSTAHAFVDGVGLCNRARIEPGTISCFEGRAIRELVPAELTADGRPFGALCHFCELRVREGLGPSSEVA